MLSSVDLSEFSGNSAKNCVTVKARYGKTKFEVDAKMRPVEVSDLSRCGFDGKEKAEKVRKSILREKGGGFECFVSSKEEHPVLQVAMPIKARKKEELLTATVLYSFCIVFGLTFAFQCLLCFGVLSSNAGPSSGIPL